VNAFFYNAKGLNTANILNIVFSEDELILEIQANGQKKLIKEWIIEILNGSDGFFNEHNKQESWRKRSILKSTFGLLNLSLEHVHKHLHDKIETIKNYCLELLPTKIVHIVDTNQNIIFSNVPIQINQQDELQNQINKLDEAQKQTNNPDEVLTLSSKLNDEIPSQDSKLDEKSDQINKPDEVLIPNSKLNTVPVIHHQLNDLKNINSQNNTQNTNSQNQTKINRIYIKNNAVQLKQYCQVLISDFIICIILLYFMNLS
jgi:hypothetical protein